MGVIHRSLDMAKQIVSVVLKPGDTAVDATVGNGRDTVFLARLVGERGRVWAFDIQQQALAAAAKLLEKEGLASRVTLIHRGHEDLARYVDDNVGAVMFNLGYLPGGDRSLVTRPDTTLLALEAALLKLRPGGVVTVVIYRGHSGGKEEEESLLGFCSKLNQASYTVMHYRMLNQINDPPSLLAIEKLIQEV